MNKNNLCNNCGKGGHIFHQCKLPIISYGIILFRHSEYGVQYLMIRRKDSFGYIDFVRGKYSPYNIEQVQKIVNEMSVVEKTRILEEPFENLWKMMWGGENNGSQYRSEEQSSSKKFDTIKNGVITDSKELITLQNIVENSNTCWSETEWEFPKGRRNYQEKDLECALREFEEETGLSKDDVILVDNLFPFEEIFIGSNHKSYKHKYYLGHMKDHSKSLNNYQLTEVSKLEWKTFDECLASIRPYNLEKKQLITNVNKVLQQYRLYL
jgi:8-oxo-dGTP pyrophosphatase MutT (NUDIX family)